MSSSHTAVAATQDTTRSTQNKAPEKSLQLSGQTASTRSGSMSSRTHRGFAAVNGPQSQPMTATSSSSSSDAPGQEATSSNALAPYGTRSRNRIGAPRPNYAEDHDVDTEFETTGPTSRGHSAKKSSSSHVAASPPADSDKMTGVSTRRTHATTNGSNATASGKDAIPGTSSFSANPHAGNGISVSKKRKQPGSSTTTPPVSASNGSCTSSKKFVAAAGGSVDSQKSGEKNMMSFYNCRGYLKNGKLKADDGTVLSINDHVYLICEPPGEPYYLARIMEFLPSKDNPSGPIETLRVNWYYRPRDIQRKVADMRLVFASMHSDTCPLTSLRGKCQILHQSEIKNLEEYRKTKDCFWFEKMYDRYIHRYYEVIPTSRVINVPQHVKKVLDERWKFVLVEMGRRKELTSAVKTCKRCSLYAANSDSVDCAVCHNTYHMSCVRPVLQKKPARGFAWACAPCSRAQERKLEARNTPIIGEAQAEAEPELLEEEEDDAAAAAAATGRSSPSGPNGSEHPVRPATFEQIAQAKLWPFRYLGIHCRVEDALDYDDRIYPRASSRLGPRHQAIVNPWHGRPVEYVKAPEVKRKYLKASHKKDLKLSKEAVAVMEAEKAERARRPKWVMDEPVGYVPRGEDGPVCVSGKQVRTTELLFKMPDTSKLPSRGEDDSPGGHLSDVDREKCMDDYMTRAKEIASSKGIEPCSTNFLDKAVKLIYEENFIVDSALTRLKQVNKYSDLKEPHLRPDEIKAFETGVAKHGSELRNITKHVGTVPHRHIVRYYYMWKKTPKGRQIWGNFEGRRGKKAAKRADNATKLVDDVADDHDDSAFDTEKATDKKLGFFCKFCTTRASRQWRRAPGTPPGTTVPAESSSKRDKGLLLTVALCQRCALLWRKYGIQWEDADEVAKKIAQGGNKSWRRRLDEELLAQLLTSSESEVKINSATAATATAIGIPVSAEMTAQALSEPAKKKAKLSDRDSSAATSQTSSEPATKKKVVVEKPPEPPALVPEPPKAKTLPCAICNKTDPMGDQHLSCRDCRLTVHRGCYGVSPTRSSIKWFCDMCSNDRNPVISTLYECVLCPVTWTEHDLMEPPKISHKKKTDREREKERLEKEMVTEAIKLYRQRQEAVGKPIGPREPLKRTAGNNWVHVTCALWTPEIKFGNAKELEPAEGLGLIPPERYHEICKICKTQKGACVSCQNPTCNARFHVGCAHQAGYIFGFDIAPVKSSRRDSVNTMKLGEEAGAATAAIWCSHHAITTIVHEMSEPSETEGLNALQLFAQTSKQADLTLTGTARKAAHVQQSVGASIQNGLTPANRRFSIVNSPASQQQKDVSPSVARSTQTSPTDSPPKLDSGHDNPEANGSRLISGVSDAKKCYRCQLAFSPKWWHVESSQELSKATSGAPPINGVGPNEPIGLGHSGAATSSSPPFRTSSHIDNPKSVANGDVTQRDKDRPASAVHDASRDRLRSVTFYECHRCHFKKPSESPSVSELRPSPYPVQRDPSLPAPRPNEFSHHPYGPAPHAHPGQQPPGLPIPPIVPEWQPEYKQRPGDYPNAMLRNAIPSSGPQANGIPLGPPGFHGGPPPPPPPHINGYPPLPSHHQGHPTPHYPNGVPPPPPPPHSYPTHQSPYGPMPMVPAGGHPPPPSSGRPYGAVGSPPTAHFSPQHSLSGPTPGPPSRMYPVDRTIAPSLPSPSSSRRSLDPQRPATPGIADENTGGSASGPAAAAARPGSSGRYNSINGTGSGTGASASPSLKNLLS